MKWPNKKYKIGENHLCRSVFFCHADFADDADFFLMGFFIHRMPRNLFRDFLLRRLLTDFRRCDLSGRCRYPLRVENVPQISQIYTDFSWDVFFSHADFADDADFFLMGFFFIGFHGIYSEISCCGDYLRIFADATCPVVTDTPWEWKMSHRFHRFSQIFLGTKPSHEEKSARRKTQRRKNKKAYKL